MNETSRLFLLSVALTMMFLPGRGSGLQAQSAPAETPHDQVQVGRLLYAPGQKTKCFSTMFLYAVARESTIDVARRFTDVPLDSDRLFDYPMVVMFGEGPFRLDDRQQANLRSYLAAGGFVLASSSCKDRRWNDSFRKMLETVLPDCTLQPLPPDHPLFSTIYRISAVQSSRSADARLYGLYLGKRLVMVWSPVDLRDPPSMGADCCCCGANYVRNAQQINANILAYVLTH